MENNAEDFFDEDLSEAVFTNTLIISKILSHLNAGDIISTRKINLAWWDTCREHLESRTSLVFDTSADLTNFAAFLSHEYPNGANLQRINQLQFGPNLNISTLKALETRAYNQIKRRFGKRIKILRIALNTEKNMLRRIQDFRCMEELKLWITVPINDGGPFPGPVMFNSVRKFTFSIRESSYDANSSPSYESSFYSIYSIFYNLVLLHTFPNMRYCEHTAWNESEGEKHNHRFNTKGMKSIEEYVEERLAKEETKYEFRPLDFSSLNTEEEKEEDL